MTSRPTELMYVLALALVATTAWTGSVFTNKGVRSEWYRCVRPGLTPPAAVFPWVWTTLYIMIAVAFGSAMASGDMVLVALFIINLILNAMWCYWYFYARHVSAALVNIALLWASTLAIIVVGKANKLVVACTLPYLGWISFASLLNMVSLDKAAFCGKLKEKRT